MQSTKWGPCFWTIIEQTEKLGKLYPKSYKAAVEFMDMLPASIAKPEIKPGLEDDGVRLLWNDPRTSVIIWENDCSFLIIFPLACKHQQFSIMSEAADYLVSSMQTIREYSLTELLALKRPL